MDLCLTAILLLATTVAGNGGSSGAQKSEMTATMSVNVSLDVAISENNNAATPPDRSPMLRTVVVGADGRNVFQPSHISADLGDIVRFRLLNSSNHTVTQSSFEYPCVPSGSFDTEYLPADDEVIDFVVTTTAPQWFFCRQTVPTRHCDGGMRFAINPEGHWLEFVAMPANGTSTTQSVSAFPTVSAHDNGDFHTGIGTATGTAVATECDDNGSILPTGFAYPTAYVTGLQQGSRPTGGILVVSTWVSSVTGETTYTLMPTPPAASERLHRHGRSLQDTTLPVVLPRSPSATVPYEYDPSISAPPSPSVAEQKMSTSLGSRACPDVVLTLVLLLASVL